MNIEGSILASVLQPVIAADGSGQSLIDNGPSTGGFADALRGQLASLGEANAKGTLPPGQYVAPVALQPANPPARFAEFSDLPGDRQYDAAALPPLPEPIDQALTQPEAVDVDLPANAAFQNGRTSAQSTAGETGAGAAGQAADPKAALEAVTDSLSYGAKGNAESAPLLAPEHPVERYSLERQSVAEHSVKSAVAMTATTVKTAGASKGSDSEVLPAVPALAPSLRHPDSEKIPLAQAADTGAGGDDASAREMPLVEAVELRPQTVETPADRQSIRQDGGQKPEDSDRDGPAYPEFTPNPQSPVQSAKNGPSNIESGEDAGNKPNQRAVLPETVEQLPRQKIDRADSTVHAGNEKRKAQDSDKDTDDPAQAIPSMTVLTATPVPPQPVSAAAGEEKSFDDFVNEDAGRKISSQPFIKPLFEELKPNGAGTQAAPEDASKQEGEFGRVVKEFQFPNVDPPEKSPPSNDAHSNEAGLSAPDTDNVPPRGMVEVAQSHRQPSENRADMPAMTKPMQHPDWNKDLGERILWMNHKELSAAEIKLNPEHLGPISVRIEMQNDQATIAFTAQHAAVREVLEASIPKLREMMNEQQLNLTDVNISQNTSSGQQQQQSSSQQSPKHFEAGVQPAGSMAEAGEEPESGGTVVNKGLLNIYA